jgi:HAD superfamily hydrolase (TIGR01509 family)
MSTERRHKGIFFDLDGTLADNLDLMFAVYKQFLESCGRNPTQEEFNSLNGPPLREVIGLLMKRHSLAGPEEALLENYNTLLDELYVRAWPAPGARHILRRAKESGWLVAVVTSNSQRRTTGWLEHHKMASFVDLVISGDDCEGKPSPAPYIMAMDKGKCSAARSFAVEDSFQGVQSALAAGLKTFCYLNGRNQEVQLPENVYRLQHFDDLEALL